MKKKISILAAVIAVLGMSPYPAIAGLLGMPLNLKAATGLRDAQRPTWQFSTDDAFADPILIWEC
jgi:hypothetical protein